MDASSIAAEAACIPPPDRDRFIEERCAESDDLLRRVRRMVDAAMKAEAACLTDLDETSPLATIGSPQAEDLSFQTPPTVLPDEADRLAELCERFRSAWAEGAPGWIDFMPPSSAATNSFRDQAAYRLVQIDCEERFRRGLPVVESDYLKPLPECRAVIRSALTRRSDTAARGGTGDPDSAPVTKSQSEDAGGPWELRARHGEPVRYQPINLRARGGLGEVHTAKDMELGRIVALKRIRPDRLDRPGSRDRFLFEAEVTGSLEHPGIVPIYSLVKQPDGSPFYAMRLIRGETLSAAIRRFHPENATPTADSFLSREFRQLIRRVIDTCNAVHFAHQRGVLHRDLKPDNVMLGEYGETLVVDWGLAKLRFDNKSKTGDLAVGESPTLNEQPEATAVGAVVGTPMFMSPEQAFGLHDELTPASDVYSLGAILFFLVSGNHPIEGRSTREILFNVRAGIRRDLRNSVASAPRPLVSICDRAMNKSPDARYHSALQLADDLDRWLGDELVEAHAARETLVEKSGRLIRRYRSWTIAGATSLLAIAAVSSASAILIQRAKSETERFRGEAVTRYRDSRDAVDTFLVQTSDAFEYFPGTQSMRRWLLESAAEKYAELAESPSEDPELELERGRVLTGLGDIAQMQQRFGLARERYQQAQILFASAGDFGTRRLLSSELRHRFETQQASILTRIGITHLNEEELDKALGFFNQAMERLQAIERRSPTILGRRFLADAMLHAGEAELRAGELTAAKSHLRSAVDVYGRIRKPEKQDRLGNCRTQELLGRLHTHLGEHPLADERFHAAVAGLTSLSEESPDDPEILNSLASTLVSHAASFRMRGDVDAERDALEQSVLHYRALRLAIPDVPLYDENLSITLSDLGLLMLDADRCRDAIPVFEEATQLASNVIAKYGPSVNLENQLAVCGDGIGQAYLAIGEPVRARQLLAQTVATYQQLFRSDPGRPEFLERLAIAQSHYAQCFADREPGTETVENSERVASEAFEGAIGLLGDLCDRLPQVPRYRAALAHVHFEFGEFLAANDREAARSQYSLAIDHWNSLGAERDSFNDERLAWTLLTCPIPDLGDPGAAIEIARRAVEATPRNRHFRCTLAAAQARAGLVAEAEDRLAFLKDSERSGRESLVLAYVMKRRGDLDESARLAREGADWFEHQASNNRDYRVLLRWLEE